MIIIKQLRIHQWLKNLFVFIPIFVTGNFLELELIYYSFLSFLIFSITASSVYILNDLNDLEADKLHPKKAKRPLASGELSKNNAILLLLFLTFINISLNIYFTEIFHIILIYIFINILYTYKFKNLILVDIFIISFGFILRVVSGAVGTDLDISEWLISLTFFLSLLLIIGKRFAEYSLIEDKSREVLQKYNQEFLKNSIIIVSTLILNTYLIYSIGFGNFQGNINLAFLSNIPVIFSLLRYNFLISTNSNNIEDPSKLLLKDKYILFSVISWAVIIFLSFLIS